MFPTWSTLTAAPHRIPFLAGAGMALASVSWWLLDLTSRYAGGTGLAPDGFVGPVFHAWVMLYGLFPFFIFGFLFTAVPNWLNSGKIARPAYTTTGVLMALGVALTFFLPTSGMVLHLIGWGVGLMTLLRTIVRTPPQDKRHSQLICTALGLGWVGNALFLLWLWTDLAGLLAWAQAMGVWAFLVPVFLTVCHRMVPWFTSRVVPNYVLIRPYGPLLVMLVASLLHGLLEALALARFTWLVDLPLMGIAFWFASRWGIARSFGVRLLAMLHVGFVWSGLAFLLYAADSLARFVHLGWGAGLAPLHALGIGFFTTMLVGMASRVTLGHSGRPLEADSATWWLIWLVQAMAVVRILPDLLPPLQAWSQPCIFLTGLLWLATFGLWAWKYAPAYWRPRLDGKPG
ncbi:MAG TPA: NnrS family protein [Thiobacillaceae bacterium]|nr:NnrS family protein [Thiobacillaceae bacterium]